MLISFAICCIGEKSNTYNVLLSPGDRLDHRKSARYATSNALSTDFPAIRFVNGFDMAANTILLF